MPSDSGDGIGNGGNPEKQTGRSPVCCATSTTWNVVTQVSVQRADANLGHPGLSSLCAARKRSRGNRVRVDSAGSGEARTCCAEPTFLIPEPALSGVEGLAPKIGPRTWATSEGSSSARKTGDGAAFVIMRCEKKESWKSSQSGRGGIGRSKGHAARSRHS